MGEGVGSHRGMCVCVCVRACAWQGGVAGEYTLKTCPDIKGGSRPCEHGVDGRQVKGVRVGGGM